MTETLLMDTVRQHTTKKTWEDRRKAEVIVRRLFHCISRRRFEFVDGQTTLRIVLWGRPSEGVLYEMGRILKEERGFENAMYGRKSPRFRTVYYLKLPFK